MTANPYRGEVEIDLGSQTHVLRLDLKGVARLETKLGQSFGQIFGSAGINTIALTIQAALTANGKRYRNVTTNMIIDWIMESGKPLSYYSEAVSELLSGALNVEAEEGSTSEGTDEDPLAEKGAPKLASA